MHSPAPLTAAARDALRRVAFWAAVALPLVYLPVVFAPLSVDAPVIAALVGAHAVALYVGRGHRLPEPRTERRDAGGPVPDAD